MLEAIQLTKRFGALTAVDAVSFAIETGQTLALLGTSGSGKSTLLRMLNRLLEPDGGRVLLDGEDIMDRPAHELRRGIGYVIQHIGLFPHLTTAQNIATVPRLLGWDKARTERRSRELLERLSLDPDQFLPKYPHEMSGGQQQRVGIARALVADPPIVLLDEPFGALDNITRDDIRKDFRELEELSRKTTVIVTHDTIEAFELGDQVGLMDAGKLVQIGPPEELLFEPANEFVADFLAPQRTSLQLRTIELRDLIDHLPKAEDTTLPQLSAAATVFSALERIDRTDQPHRIEVASENYWVGRTSLLEAFAKWEPQVSS